MEAKKTFTDCHFYSKGLCTKGEGCEFRHIHTPKTFESTKICKSWRLETCEDRECPFRHPTLPRATDGSLIQCAFETHGGCAKRDFCPYFHKYEPKPSIPGLSDEEIPSRLQITLNPPSTEPRFVGKTSPSAATADETTTTQPNGTEAQETVEPPPKKLRPFEGAKKGISSIVGLDGPTNSETKPQAVSFVKSFQEILKQREQEEKGKDKEKTEEKEQQTVVAQITTKQGGPGAAARKAEKRKTTEPPKKQLTPKAPPQQAQQQQQQQEEQRQQQERKKSVLDRLSRPLSGSPTPVTPAAAASSPTSSKPPPSFGIKSLGELMKERQEGGQPKQEQQGQATNPATSAAARAEPEAKKQKREQSPVVPAAPKTISTTTTPTATTQPKPSPSILGQKRKLDATTNTPQPVAKPSPTPITTPTAVPTTKTVTPPTTTPTPTPTTKQQPTTTTATPQAEEELLENFEKELEELGVVIDGEEDVDVDIDLGDLGE